MPVDTPAPSALPTNRRPSTPQAAPLPAPEYETVWLHTFLAQFTNPADRDALQRFGGLLYTATLSAGYVGNRDRLVAADVRSRSSTMLQHRLRRGASYLAPRRSQRAPADFHHGLLD